MQLRENGGTGIPTLRQALKVAAAGLLANGAAKAQEAPPATSVDSGVLYYHENGRVQAVEPELNISEKINENSTLSVGVVFDSLTGPTPYGAVPSTLPQTYVRPYKIVAAGAPVTLTTSSGGSTVVVLPPVNGAKTETLTATRIVPPNSYPLDPSFHDTRVAGHAGWEQSLTSTLKLDGGLAYSHEYDYRSASASLGLSKDLNAHNTTLSAAVNYESDLSFPVGGTPVPFTPMSGDFKGPNATRSEVDAVVGITQVMSRQWLSTLSYSYAGSHGYQINPYKIITVVDALSGQPTMQLYENRPEQRRKQSVFLENKVHLPSDVVSLALRAYKDDWGIQSATADLRYRYQITQDYYLEPHLRYYQQGAADFYHYYLVAGDALPQYASADTRLAKFTAQTYGMKFGMPFNVGSEFNVRVEYYDQRGNGSPSYAIGQLKQQNLFPDLKAFTLLLGYSYAF